MLGTHLTVQSPRLANPNTSNTGQLRLTAHLEVGRVVGCLYLCWFCVITLPMG